MAVTVRELLAAPGTCCSFEFFPPKTDEGEARLWRAIAELDELRPSFVSVTYGAGGSTRDRTLRIVARMVAETDLVPVAHLTCVGASRDTLRDTLSDLAEAGVRNVLAIRGDPPGGPGTAFSPHPDGLAYAAELVRLAREVADFCVGVAAFPDVHPESTDRDSDVRNMAAKCAAGADYAITQFFFGIAAYDRLVADLAAAGRPVPVIAGIMPVTNVAQIERMAQMSGAELPAPLAERLHAVADDPLAVRRVGVAVATDLCHGLLERGVPGLHFYTLNRSTATREVWEALGRPSTTRPAHVSH
jgi:methylenetetrahydrofolate reductase (NADPH)